MFRRSILLSLSFLFVACAAPVSDDGPAEAIAEELTTGTVYVRITGTCFQSYEMKAVNTGATLGASKLVFRPGEESKQFAFCAGTDRVVLRGNKTADGNFAVDRVWMQTSGATVSQDVEIVRALRTSSGETFERALNATPVRRVSLDLGSHVLSEAASRQLASGWVLFAGPRAGSSGGGSGSPYGQPSTPAGSRRVDAVFEEME